MYLKAAKKKSAFASLVFLMPFFTGLVYGAIPQSERAALIALYDSTNGDNWNNNSGWKTPPLAADGFAMPGTEGSWLGIRVENSTVIHVYLPLKNLTGIIPGELGNLSNLKLLELSFNHLTGRIPAELGNLSKLVSLRLRQNRLTGSMPKELGNLKGLYRIDLSNNRLSGSIPRELGNLTALGSLALSWNNLSGSIPMEFGYLSNLRRLYLYTNRLTGSMPKELGNLSKLEVMEIYSNQLTGHIPKELGNLSKLEVLEIDSNQLTGSIPKELGNLTNLNKLRLDDNQLTGSIPKELGNLSNLVWLFIQRNQLSGSIPGELGNLSNLEKLYLHYNKLSGTIPGELGNLSKLIDLMLDNNQLTGSIPKELGNLSKLIDLSLNNNQLSGSIPGELENMKKLRYLYLLNNQLSGSIPPELGNMENLYFLNLGDNQLSGNIPPELGNMENLYVLNLGDNQLSGNIPPELGNMENLDDLNLSNNQLSGAIPPELGNMKNLDDLNLSHNHLSGNIPKELENIPFLWHLNLDNNQLSGNIPKELGNLSCLITLSFSSNRLTGSIPAELGYLICLENDNSDFKYNGLYTDNEELKIFLNSKQKGGDWESTQTIAPTGVTAAAAGINSIQVRWQPIQYSEDPGGYQVFYGEKPGGPYIVFKTTANKWVSQMRVTGLKPATAYYFVVRTITEPHEFNQNTIVSDYSAEASAVTLPLESLTIVLQEPQDGEVLSGTVAIKAVVTSGTASKVEFYIDNTKVKKLTTGPYEYSWDTTTVPDGNHTIKAIAYGPADQTSRDEITVNVTNVTVEPPHILLDRTRLNYGADSNGNMTGPQDILVANTGEGTLVWTAAGSAQWLVLSPSSGTGNGIVNVSVNPTGLVPGTHTAAIAFECAEADNSPRTVEIYLNIYDTGTAVPFGTFETPVDYSTAAGNVPMTGWVLDDIEVERVKIYREAVPGEGAGLVYIGESVLVEGSRPDIEESYPSYPKNHRAGWGYMLLTNLLPNQGNGTFTFYAKAADIEGNEVTLGSKIISIDNANSLKPFGAIDTPARGGVVSGRAYVNFGWALTPQPNFIPRDGSTIDVYIDGVKIGHPIYNQYRQDIAALFPGCANSDGAVGYFFIDTTVYANGVHTIMWTVTDSAGNSNNIGNRYFSIRNFGNSGAHEGSSTLKGFDPEKDSLQFQPGNSDLSTITIKELERVEIRLGDNISAVRGFLEVNGRFVPLPIGSSLNFKTGTFCWSPGPGFIGSYTIVFVIRNISGEFYKKKLIINITPKISFESPGQKGLP